MKKTIQALLTISAVSFVLNLFWENAQAPLYKGYISFIQHLQICAIASLGDVVIILFLYALYAVITRDILWFRNQNWRSIVSLIIIGAIIGVGIEKWSLLTHRWSYAESMPIILLIKVGLSPVLQMIVLPIITFYITHLILKKTSYVSR